jgi:hypothetical protein
MMASYDLKAILGEKLKRLTDKTLKSLVDCMCTVAASLCSLDKRVSALENVELPEGGYKPMQEPVASPSASGTAIQFIESMSQDATGRMTAKKKTVQDGTTSQKGVVQLAGSISADVASENNKAATEKAVRDAINALDSRLSPNSDMYVAEYGVISEFTAMTNARGDGKKVCVAVGLGGGSSGFNSAEAIVPLSYVEFGSGGAVVAFYFNMPRDSYGDVNARGSILQVKCTSAGWDVTTLSPYYADTAGSANTAGSATNATNATNDGAGSEIKSTYVCNAKLVNGGGGTLYPGSSFTVLSGAAIKRDDATIGNRKYVELTYRSYGLGVGTRIQQVGAPYMTYNDPDTYLELSKTAFSIAGRKSQNGYFNALTSLLIENYNNLIEVDFDYDVVATNSTSSIGVVFCLASTMMVGTPQTTIATNDGRIFAFATVSGQGVGGHLRGHIHITGYLQSSQIVRAYGLCIGARSIYGDYSGTCTLKITNVNIKDSYATYT